MLTLLTLMGCPTAITPDDTAAPEPDEASNLCGTIVAPAEAPEVTGANVLEVADDRRACVGGDTGGAGWWGDSVATPEVEGDFFQATVEPGTYGVEVYTAGDWGGCAEAVVADTSTCSADIVVTVDELIYVDKPNVYLYPTERTRIDVKVPAWRRITESEPRYPVDGWRVVAEPDGLLRTAAGPRDFLFYELNFDLERLQTEEGWCVRGSQAQASVEDAMADMGFLPNEIADFAEAWDPTFPTAPWMTVFPQVDDLSALRIDPAPDALLRAWFLVTEGCRAERAFELPRVARTGYHAAEWGVAFGRELDAPRVIVEGWRP